MFVPRRLHLPVMIAMITIIFLIVAGFYIFMLPPRGQYRFCGTAPIDTGYVTIKLFSNWPSDREVVNQRTQIDGLTGYYEATVQYYGVPAMIIVDAGGRSDQFRPSDLSLDVCGSYAFGYRVDLSQ